MTSFSLKCHDTISQYNVLLRINDVSSCITRQFCVFTNLQSYEIQLRKNKLNDDKYKEIEAVVLYNL
jgi:hypothetical protein